MLLRAALSGLRRLPQPVSPRILRHCSIISDIVGVVRTAPHGRWVHTTAPRHTKATTATMSSDLTFSSYPVSFPDPPRVNLVISLLNFHFVRAMQFLAELGLQAENPGLYNGSWGGSGSILTSVSPTTGKPIATVRQATIEEYESCIAAMTDAQEAWQLVR